MLHAALIGFPSTGKSTLFQLMTSALDAAGEIDSGELRLEGKEYVVQDGDILNFRHAT